MLCTKENLNQFSEEESIKATFSEMKNEMELIDNLQQKITTEQKGQSS